MVALRCVPSDFVNPFVVWPLVTAVCGGLLLLEALALYVSAPRWQRAVSRPWVTLVPIAAAIWAFVLAAWALAQSLTFVAWCAGFRQSRLAEQAFAVRAIAALVNVTVWATAALLIVGAIMVLARIVLRQTKVRAGDHT
jgi:hypothetical protein